MSPSDDRAVVVARIGAPQGVRGELRVQPFTDDPLAIENYSPLAVLKPKRGLPEVLTVKSARPSKNVLVVRFAEVTTREMAEALKGAELAVPRARLDDGDLEEDEFFITDLIGLEARLSDGAVLGTVTNVDDHGAGDVLTIRNAGGGNQLLAFTLANVPELDVAGGWISIVLPDEVDARGDGAPNAPKPGKASSA